MFSFSRCFLWHRWGILKSHWALSRPLFSALWQVTCLCSNCCPLQKKAFWPKPRVSLIYGLKYQYLESSLTDTLYLFIRITIAAFFLLGSNYRLLIRFTGSGMMFLLWRQLQSSWLPSESSCLSCRGGPQCPPSSPHSTSGTVKILACFWHSFMS